MLDGADVAAAVADVRDEAARLRDDDAEARAEEAEPDADEAEALAAAVTKLSIDSIRTNLAQVSSVDYRAMRTLSLVR